MRYVKNFFDLPFDCKPLQLESKLVRLYAPPAASVNLQVGFTDHPSQADTIVLQICNKLRFVMDFTVDGAVSEQGFITGRIDYPLETHVTGERGDLATFKASFTPHAVTATLALLAVEALAHSISIHDNTVHVVFNPKTITTVATATQSCQATIAAALASSTPDPLLAVWNCLKQLELFQGLVVDLLAAKAAKLGFSLAGVTLGHVKAIMIGQTFNRVIAETWIFDLPKPYSFQLSLLCAPGRVCLDPTTTTTSTTTSTTTTSTTQPVRPLTPEEVVQRFWEATVSGDRARAIQFGTPDAYDLLRENLNIPGAAGYQFQSCSRIDPGTTYRGVLYTRGAYLCGFALPPNPFGRLLLVVVPIDGGRAEVRGIFG